MQASIKSADQRGRTKSNDEGFLFHGDSHWSQKNSEPDFFSFLPIAHILGKKKAKKRKRGSKREENKKEAEGPQGAKPKAVDENKGLVTKEERNVGAVASTVYKKYMVAGGGYLKFSLVYFGFILSAANGLATVSWVSYWTTDATYEKHSQEFYLGLYALFACK